MLTSRVRRLKKMETLEVTGRSVEEAIEIALERLGADRDQVEIDVVNPGKGGILGFGAEPALIRVSLNASSSNLTAIAQLTVETLIRNMNADASIRVNPAESTDDRESVQVEISGEDSGLLIGNRGETLKAIQFISSLLIRNKSEGRVFIDVEGYRDRRNASIKALASKVAQRVISTGKAITLEPMTPNERRVVHMTLSENTSVETESTGGGNDRRVTISPL
ncbi:MAG: protein jag [SAR202 cluster bacterium]|nr:protein jag [SAR202 cluster bacterium]